MIEETLESEIVQALKDYRRATVELGECKATLIRLIVETGVPQHEAIKMRQNDYLDGYLMGFGITPEYRLDILDNT